jgi:uncharacterized protein
VKYKEITGAVFKEMLIGAVSLLDKNKETLNDLNVFPVPDGDTGTNMSMTMMASIQEVKLSSDETVTSVADAASLGALKGARGNSGVILSQILRGFAKGLKGDIKTMQAEHLALAAEKGVEAAYKAVMKPQEGTILTIARSLSDEANICLKAGDDVLVMLKKMLHGGEEMLKRTPDMLPVLKEAGVVDAGGEGLLVIYRGFLAVLNGEKIEDIVLEAPESVADFDLITGNEDIEFAYCTEFFIKQIKKAVLQKDVDKFRDDLSKIGDSVLVVGDLNLIKVHFHTNHPGQGLENASKLGELSKIKIDNMREQHRKLESAPVLEKQEKQKPIALVAVASGEGLVNIFKDFLVDEVIQGGQTMNPSAQVIAEAIEKAPSQNIIVFPNNKNIIMAAEQAAKMSKKNVHVVPSKSLPQGISGVLAYNPEMAVEYNVTRMKGALDEVKTGQVTYAIRDAKANGHKINEGEIIGIKDSEIVCHDKNITKAVMTLLENMVDEEDGIITIFYGEGVSEKDAKKIADLAEEKFDDCDIELHSGGQPIYSYIFSVE